ncbi:unnamed protein product [Spirodela intermedia]|uniref:Uncharacterized protein n=1 Tax=Spirodela intermedia TaxID=51605 RepID=A0A7I8JNZ9_SPIIN|nr:unnamed protein product [Spirodela intermedia]CAA6671293.1 unnamed protein product [Spirodela intermedia]
MFLDFRSREYRLEEERAGAALPSRTAAHDHPLASASSPSMRSSSERARTEAFQKVDSADYQNVAVNDPLRVHGDQIGNVVDPSGVFMLIESSDQMYNDFPRKRSDESVQHSVKEWAVFTKGLSQKFSHSSMANVTVASDILPGILKGIFRTFYPVLFVLVTEIMDLLGDLVWDRIKRKAEWTDDGNFICALQDDFVPGDVSFDAKELCYNWFAKIGSIHELLPRMKTLILPWRLTMMMRGLADPVTSAYCHLYMVHCVQSLDPGDVGYLVISINDISISLRRIIIEKEITGSNLGGNKRLLISLLEPAIEWIMKVMLKAEKHELPGNIVLINALELLELIKCSSDISFEQHLNFRLLGLKLSENQLSVNHSDITVKKVLQVVSQYDGLAEYLIVLDAYFEIILQNTVDSSVSFVLDGVVKRAENRSLTGNEMDSLLSILVKVIHNLNGLEDVLALKHFIQIFDLLNGDPRITASRHILGKNHTISFEASRALHDGINFSSSKDGNHTIAGLICRFVQTVDFGDEMEGQLQFLVECRVAFRNINELKVYFIHSSNALATRGIKNVDKFLGFIRACIAFSEVTIPSILDASCCLNLYLETAEVALSAGLISHVDGLVGAAISCLESTNLNIGSFI